MSKQATEFQKKEMSRMYRGKEIFKPLNTGWVDEHVACVREWVANIFFYRKGGTTIMIDAGYNYDRLAEKMGWLGIDPAGIRHILITHKAVNFTAKGRQFLLIDSGPGHSGVSHDMGTTFDGFHSQFCRIWGKAEIIGIIKICRCMDTAFYDGKFRIRPGSAPQLAGDDLHAVFLYIFRFYNFNFI